MGFFGKRKKCGRPRPHWKALYEAERDAHARTKGQLVDALESLRALMTGAAQGVETEPPGPGPQGLPVEGTD